MRILHANGRPLVFGSGPLMHSTRLFVKSVPTLIPAEAPPVHTVPLCVLPEGRFDLWSLLLDLMAPAIIQAGEGVASFRGPSPMGRGGAAQRPERGACAA
jgi:hypothetical protein